MERGGEYFDGDSLWWLFERLAASVSVDYHRFAPEVQSAAAKLEEELEQAAAQAEEEAVRLMGQGLDGQARALLNGLMESGVRQAKEFAMQRYQVIRTQLGEAGGIFGARREFLEDYCARTHMEIL